MKNHKFTATAPDGTVHTRSSKTRSYTHAVMVDGATDLAPTRTSNDVWGPFGWSQSANGAENIARTARKCYGTVTVVAVDNPRPAE